MKLASSAIDCTFSGSTGIVVYIANGKLYSCNAGDSRAVLARSTVNSGTGEGKLVAIPLSDDQKPEREDEKKRILENKGRVEACKGVKGEDIGPPRVWLSHQDVPGLAMSRRCEEHTNTQTSARREGRRVCTGSKLAVTLKWFGSHFTCSDFSVFCSALVI